MKKIVFYFVTLVILSIIFLPKLIDLYNKFSCEITGKKYLMRSDNKRVCIEEFNDAGKECHFASECKGRCVWIQPTPVYLKTPTSEGYYNPPQQEYKGVCSRYSIPSECLNDALHVNYSEGIALDNSGIPDHYVGCRPPLIY